MSKRLARYYVKQSDQADRMTALLQKYNLSSVSPHVQKHTVALSADVERFEACVIVSASSISADEICAIKERLSIPQEVLAELETDVALVDGVTVYYQGKKWNDSVQGRIGRFVTRNT